jgi:beta-glucosidase-like glycosyl hydrolase
MALRSTVTEDDDCAMAELAANAQAEANKMARTAVINGCDLVMAKSRSF